MCAHHLVRLRKAPFVAYIIHAAVIERVRLNPGLSEYQSANELQEPPKHSHLLLKRMITTDTQYPKVKTVMMNPAVSRPLSNRKRALSLSSLCCMLDICLTIHWFRCPVCHGIYNPDDSGNNQEKISCYNCTCFPPGC